MVHVYYLIVLYKSNIGLTGLISRQNQGYAFLCFPFLRKDLFLLIQVVGKI